MLRSRLFRSSNPPEPAARISPMTRSTWPIVGPQQLALHDEIVADRLANDIGQRGKAVGTASKQRLHRPYASEELGRDREHELIGEIGREDARDDLGPPLDEDRAVASKIWISITMGFFNDLSME